jgi:hypothetical protein
LAQKVVPEMPKKLVSKDVRCPQNQIFKTYRSISGITGHPLKNKKKWSFIYPLAVGCKYPFVNISLRSKMVEVKLMG